MSRGGRGGSSATGVRAIASVLGIAKHEVGAFTQLKREPTPLYPPMLRKPLEPKLTTDVMFMTDLKQELVQRFHESSCYQEKRGRKDITRYTDKFRRIRKEPFEPDFARVPSELNYEAAIVGKVKKRKLNDDDVQRKLAKLEEKEKTVAVEDPEVKEEEDPDETEKKPGLNDEEEEPPSDDDYLEEDNDYVHNYFDNGEGYGDSDDNLEDDNVY